MSDTLTGVIMIVVGLLMAIFSAPLARLQRAVNKYEQAIVPFAWSRGVIVFIGGLLSFSGLLIVLGLPRS